MKKNLILIIALMILAGFIAFVLQKSSTKEKFIVQAIDQKGIFVGDQKFAPSKLQESKIPPEILEDQKRHEASLRAIDEASEYIRIGDRYAKANNLQEAAIAYEKSYSVGGGARAVSGLLLAAIYEKLGRYDEGIALLDEMIAKPYLSENGIKNANEIRARLVAAKK